MSTPSTAPGADTRIAVLIDCDNVSSTHAGAVLEELAAYGTPTIKRAYGDWTTNQLAGWKKELNRRAIQPVQQFAYTTGKNSTDSALIIDAMDLLWMGNVEAFAIVSSDSDFTRLATRLRESGKKVIGLGRRRTPASLRNAVDQFIYLELLGQGDDDGGTEGDPGNAHGGGGDYGNAAGAEASASSSEPAPADAATGGSSAGEHVLSQHSVTFMDGRGAVTAPEDSSPEEYGTDSEFGEDATSPDSGEAAGAGQGSSSGLAEDEHAPRINLQSALTKAINATSDDDGWATLSLLGQHLNRTHADFDPRDFGHRKLSTLVAEQSYLDHRREGRNLQVRLKQRSTGKTRRRSSSN